MNTIGSAGSRLGLIPCFRFHPSIHVQRHSVPAGFIVQSMAFMLTHVSFRHNISVSPL